MRLSLEKKKKKKKNIVLRCVQAWILIERVKSGADRTLYG